MSRSFALCLALIAPLGACTITTTTGAHEPVIDAVDAPATVSLGADGKYHVDPTVTFHTGGDRIVEAHVDYTSAAHSDTLVLPVPAEDRASSASLQILLAFSSRLHGEVDYRITLVTESGAASEPSLRHVTLD